MTRPLGESNYIFVRRGNLRESRDAGNHREFLRQFKLDAAAMADLRGVLMESRVGIRCDRLSDDEVLACVARLLASGDLILVANWAPHGNGDNASENAGSGQAGDEGAEGTNNSGWRASPSNTRSKSWIEIELVDDDDSPVPYEPYELRLPDGTILNARLDGNGFARYSNIDPGNCLICFPKRDHADWHRV